MFRKPLTQVKFGDVKTLVDNGIAEGRLLDYKEELPGSADADKKEFLADVSSFANTVGGHLVYGVKETGGIPTAIPGLAIADDESIKLRLEQLIQSGIEPRLRTDMAVVHDGAGKTVLIIHALRSYAGPHRVVFKELAPLRKV